MKSLLASHILFSKINDLDRKKFLQAVKIIKFCYFEGAKSISDICKYLKVSLPNGNAILNVLIERRIIEKSGIGESKGGRKPDLYNLIDNAFYVVAVDMDIFQTRITILNSENKSVITTKSIDLKLDNQPETLELLITEIITFIDESGFDRTAFLGVGVSFPGLVNSRKGINYTYFYFGSKSVKETIQERVKLPVFIENDAKAIALWVWRFGVAKGKKDVLVLFLNWGVGLGLILNGELHRGTAGLAGEFSHIPIVQDGELCICGKLGCLQTVAAGTALVKMARDGILSGSNSLIAIETQGDVDRITLTSVINAALNGDQFAINLFSELGGNLGKGIAILIQLLNPEMIVLEGQMAKASHYITTPIQQAIHTYAMAPISSHCTIKTSKMGDDIGLYGAMAVVMEDVFEALAKG